MVLMWVHKPFKSSVYYSYIHAKTDISRICQEIKYQQYHNLIIKARFKVKVAPLKLQHTDMNRTQLSQR